MANRQKNVKIVYNVDTSQVKAAEKTVNQAKTATDNLRNSTKQLGEQSKHTSQQYKLNINDIRGELAALQAQIERTAVTDKTRLNELIPKYRELKAQVDQFNRSLEGSAKSTAAVGVSLGGIYNAVKIALTAGLIRETANAVIEMTALAGKIEGVKRAFDKLPNSVLLMEELKQRTHGALTELELMQKALQARNFGIPIENLGKLLEFAAIKSQQTGISIQYLTDSIVTGLGRESIKILDNLQIDIGKLKQRMQETGQSMRVVVGEIVNEELKKMGGYLETGETAVNRLKASWKSFIQEASKKIESSGLIRDLSEILENMSIFAESSRRDMSFGAVFKERQALKEAAESVERFRESNKAALADRKTNIQTIEDEIQRLDKVAASHKINVMILREQIKTTEDMSFAEKEAKFAQIHGREESAKQINQEIKLLQELKRSTELNNEVEKEQETTIEGLRKKVDDLTEARDKLQITDRKGIRNINEEIEATQQLIERLERLNRARGGEGALVDNGERLDALGDKVESDADQTLQKSLELIRKKFKAQIGAISKGNKEKEKEQDRHTKEMERMERRLTDMALQSAHMVLSMWNAAASQREDNTASSLDKELEAFDRYSEAQLKTVGDNDRRRIELESKFEDERQKLEARRESAEIAAAERERQREKKERLRQIAIDTAAGIVRALTISPGIGKGGVIASGIIAANSILQAAIVNKYKEGVIDLKGPGTETSDSIPAMLSKRESVMTAAETKSSMNILKSIRARKLDDKIFEKLVVNSPAMVPTDLSPLVKEIRANRPPDIARQGYSIMETREIQKGVIRRTRKRIFAR